MHADPQTLQILLAIHKALHKIMIKEISACHKEKTHSVHSCDLCLLGMPIVQPNSDLL